MEMQARQQQLYIFVVHYGMGNFFNSLLYISREHTEGGETYDLGADVDMYAVGGFPSQR